MAHANVERNDLVPDTRIPDLEGLMGKGYLIPAPVLPVNRFRSIVLPTPMATRQADLPTALVVYDASGRQAARRFLGRLPRCHAMAIDVDELLATDATHAPPSGYGHMELIYDFRDGGGADGWLHALFRYHDRQGMHAAETSFGVHIFNTVLTYRSEPQSYSGPPPGLSTRLFLRLDIDGREAFCQLIYPASTPWHQNSSTALILHDSTGTEIAREVARIPCSGSLLWRPREIFGRSRLALASGGGYVLVRDLTCRLFGYQGLCEREQAFSLDHMFGF